MALTVTPRNELLIIGKTKILKMINEIGLSREQVALEIGLSKGGLYHITHKSGKIHIFVWNEFSKLYKKHTGELPKGIDQTEVDRLNRLAKEQIKARSSREKKKAEISKAKLSDFSTDQLIAELKKRGAKDIIF